MREYRKGKMSIDFTENNSDEKIIYDYLLSYIIASYLNVEYKKPQNTCTSKQNSHLNFKLGVHLLTS